ncbi:MAG: two pore domain potassium channel family protein [Bacteroidales bacterium]|nr:two pore domain potassium channel family protein [Bacteroidales bacterium]
MTFSIIFLVSIFVLNSWRRTMFTIAVIAFITEWIAYWIHMPVLNFVSSLTNIIFFQIIVIKLIIQIAKSKIADSRVIFESINGYLMLGLLFTLWIAIAMQYDSGSFSFQVEMPVVQDYIYFTFVTMTTLGYGDVTPLLPFARSLAILISISGQIYIAVIIAMLVGKYASQESTK